MTEDIKPIDVGPEGIRPEMAGAPTITALQPAGAICSAPDDITMIVEGDHFNRSTTIIFNGHDEPTTLIDHQHVSTGVKPSLFVVPAVCPVTVRNDGYALPAALDFSFTEAGAPLVTSAAKSKGKR